MKLIAWFAFAGLTMPTAAQSTSTQYRPELNVYLEKGETFRVVFDDLITGTQSTKSWQGYFTSYVETALKPVFRRNLREHPDVYRDRYLSMRAGYQYQTGLSSNNNTSGNVGILELTSRYHLPLDLVASDRNRGEFRSFKGQDFYTRYRNRFQVERDIKRGQFVCTPYAYAEVFYNTRYGLWTPNRYAFGVQVPAGRHTVIDTYYMRQNSSRSNPPHLNAIGFKWNLFL